MGPASPCREHLFGPPRDALYDLADMDKARVLLDWQPEVSLERRVRYLIGWYWENQSWAKEVQA